MSEFELIEAISTSTSSAGLAAMNFVAILFAYVVAAHFAGRKLPTKVVLFVSFIYTFFLVAPLLSCATNVVRYRIFAERYVNEYPDSDVYIVIPVELAVTLAIAPLIIGWVGSLAYMHGYVRARQ